MHHDGHEVTVASPPNVANLETYFQPAGFDDCTGIRSLLGHAEPGQSLRAH